MCTGVRQESTPTGRGSMSLRSVAGRKKNKCQREKGKFKKRERRIQFVSHKSPIRGIKVLKWRITMNNLWLQPFQADRAINVGDKETFLFLMGLFRISQCWGGDNNQYFKVAWICCQILTPTVHWLSRLPLNLPPSPLHLERLDLECKRGEPVPRLSHYAKMDPDSSHLSPSRKAQYWAN